MNSLTVVAFEVPTSTEVDSRTITGVAVPYDTSGRPGGTFAGIPVSFAPGSLSKSISERGNKVRLIVDHDRTRPIGKLVAHSDTAEGLETSWRIARTPAGDSVLAEAADGIRDGLSIGVDVLEHEVDGDSIRVTEARLVEVSLVAFPAYDSARVADVAATEVPRGIDPRIVRYKLNLRSSQ